MFKSRLVKLYRWLQLIFIVALTCILIVACDRHPAGQVVSNNQFEQIRDLAAKTLLERVRELFPSREQKVRLEEKKVRLGQ